MEKRYHFHFAAFFLLVALAMGSLLVIQPSLEKLTGYAIYNQGNQSEFDLGAYSNTEFSSNLVQLTSGSSSGNYTSKIFNFTSESMWNNVSWVSNAHGALADNSVDESSFQNENINMTGNWFLYHFDEFEENSVTGGSDFEDSSSNNYHANLTGATINVSGRFGKAVSFDGTGDGVNIGDVEVDDWKELSISAWVKMSSNPTNARIVSKDQVGVQGNFLLFYTTGWKMQAWDDVAGDWATAVDATLDLGDDEWHLLTGVVDDTNNEIILYVDGVEEATDTWSAATLDDADNEEIVIGADSDVGSYEQVFSGSIDEVGIWNRSLSASEVLDMYKRGVRDLNLSVRSCNDDACSGESWSDVADFSSVDLSVDNNTYFQYKFDFETLNTSYSPKLYNVSVDYDPSNTAPSVTIVSPTATLYVSNQSLALNHTTTDVDANLDSCWFTLDLGATTTTLASCGNTTFNVSGDSGYTLTVYANDSDNVLGSSSVSFDVDVTGVNVTIVSPTGTETSRTDIDLDYTATGDNLTCWYNVKTSIGGNVVSNKTISACADTQFNVSSDGDYVVNVYVNNTFGSLNYTSSSFDVSTSSGGSGSGSGSGGSSGGGGGGGSSFFGPYNKLEFVDNVSDQIIGVGSSKKVSLKVKNSGLNFLNDCKFEATSSWITSNLPIQDLSGGEEHEFIVSLEVPNNTKSGTYELSYSVNCVENSQSAIFNVDILQDKLSFKIGEVTRESDGKVRVDYSLTESTGSSQNVNLEFILYSGEKKIAEAIDNRLLNANSFGQYSILIDVDNSVEGELELLVNLKSEAYSGLVKEDIVLGKSITGFAIFSGRAGDNWPVVIIVLVFLIFSVFVLKKIIKSRRH